MTKADRIKELEAIVGFYKKLLNDAHKNVTTWRNRCQRAERKLKQLQQETK